MFISAAKFGDKNDFDWLVERYQSTLSEDEAFRILLALPSVGNSDNLNSIFNLTVQNYFEETDLSTFYSILSLRHPNETWQFYKSNFERILELYPNHAYSILVAIANNFATLELSNSFQKFLVDKKIPLTHQISLTLQLVTNNVRWSSNRSSEVSLWLSLWNSKRNKIKKIKSIIFN